MQPFNIQAIEPLLRKLQDLKEESSEVLVTQHQFFWGSHTQSGQLKRTVSARFIEFELRSTEAGSEIVVSFQPFAFRVFASNDSSPSDQNPVTRYEIVDKVVHFETHSDGLGLEIWLTFS